MVQRVLLTTITCLFGLGSGFAGSLRLVAPAGYTVRIDDRLAGRLAESGELEIRDVSAGQREVALFDSGIRVCARQVSVAPLGVTTVRWQSPGKPVVTEASDEVALVPRTGSITIRSLPVGCELEIPDAGVEPVLKTRDTWRVDNLPPGRYVVVARHDGVTLTVEATVHGGGEAAWFVDFEREEAVRAQDAGVVDGLRFVRLGEQSLWMTDREVTVGQWLALMGERAPETGVAGAGDAAAPVAVTWSQAAAFSRRLAVERGWEAGRCRLPTEAEWQLACEAGEEAPALGRVAWFADNSVAGYSSIYADGQPVFRVRPAGTRAANGWGLHDMLGSRWEWCDGGSPDARPVRGGSFRDPAAVCTAESRRLRGGAWLAGFRVITDQDPLTERSR